MTPLFITLASKRLLRIIPQTRVYMDGHPILSYDYSVFADGDRGRDNNELLPVNKEADPDYLGTITFEQPDKLFSYTWGRHRGLDSSEVEEIIEYLSHIRDNPELWQSMGQF